MIITDFNKMTVEELKVISICLNFNYEINDGKITKAINGGMKDEQN